MAEEAASRREMAELLVAHGADVNAVTRREKNTPLAFAVMAGRMEVVEVLVESGADVNVPAAFGHQPLHNAAIQGQPEITELLLAHGARVNAKDDLGLTPLHWAAVKGMLERSRGHDLVPTLPPGLRPYHMDHADVVKLLLSNGADGGIEDKKGRTPRDLALQSNNPEIARLLEDGPESGE
jgi:ankyrin repeat protein